MTMVAQETTGNTGFKNCEWNSGEGLCNDDLCKEFVIDYALKKYNSNFI